MEEFRALCPGIALAVQESGMDEAAREAFLAQFSPHGGGTLVGFCVLGGVFGEGIDLAGAALIGCVVVGVGLPQISPERTPCAIITRPRAGSGFAYAYQFPGMNKVLQAAGRVIRTKEDRGVVLLIDSRYTRAEYRCLMPPHWGHLRYVSAPGAGAGAGAGVLEPDKKGGRSRMTHVLIGVPARAEDKALWEAVPGCEFVYDEAFAAQNLAWADVIFGPVPGKKPGAVHAFEMAAIPLCRGRALLFAQRHHLSRRGDAYQRHGRVCPRIAEYALAAVLGLYNNFPQYRDMQRAGRHAGPWHAP